jgi:hypothetical protein
MATIGEVIEGLQLLATCEKQGLKAYAVDAEHDIIYAGPDISEVSPEVSARLEKLGWHRSDADRWAIFT